MVWLLIECVKPKILSASSKVDKEDSPQLNEQIDAKASPKSSKIRSRKKAQAAILEDEDSDDKPVDTASSAAEDEGGDEDEDIDEDIDEDEASASKKYVFPAQTSSNMLIALC